MATLAELFNQAISFHQSGDLARAEPLYRQVLRIDPAHADALYWLGMLAYQTGHPQPAIALLRQALAINPNNVHALTNLGNALKEHRQLDEAVACYRQALRIDPHFANAHYNLGNALMEQRQPADAVLCFRQVLLINPNHVDTHNNLGNALKDQGLYDDALACYRQALRINPNYANAYCNLANVFREQGLLDEANEGYGQALQVDPCHKPTLWNRSFLRLLRGDFQGGWPDLEKHLELFFFVPRSFQQPRWDGSPLEGKRILIHAPWLRGTSPSSPTLAWGDKPIRVSPEGALGDTFQFLRYLPLVKQRGGTVLFECQPILFDLLAGIPGPDRLIAAGNALPDFDLHVPLLSLPFLFGTTLTTIPTHNPCLAADPKLVEQWRQELPAEPGLKVGIVWQGSMNKRGDPRSLPMKHFQNLARVPGVQLVSLQVGHGTKQVAEVTFPLTDLGSRFNPNSMADLAAAMMNLDLVVTVDTAAAHLAGALGMPVWVALSFTPCWRWLINREDSPWYRTMRLFRQRKLGDWDEVFKRMALALSELNAQRSGAKS